MIKSWNDVPGDRPTFQKLVISLVGLCQSTGGLDHHDHMLNAPASDTAEPSDTVEPSDTAPHPQHSASPTANPVPAAGHGSTENEYVESPHSAINDTDNSSAGIPNELMTEQESPQSHAGT